MAWDGKGEGKRGGSIANSH